MEIKITQLFNIIFEYGLMDFSASVAEIGSNAGPETWQNANEFVKYEKIVFNAEQIQAIKHHFAQYGAWENDEITNWSNDETIALLVQEISAQLRENDIACLDDLIVLQNSMDDQSENYIAIFVGIDNEIYFQTSY